MKSATVARTCGVLLLLAITVLVYVLFPRPRAEEAAPIAAVKTEHPAPPVLYAVPAAAEEPPALVAAVSPSAAPAPPREALPFTVLVHVFNRDGEPVSGALVSSMRQTDADHKDVSGDEGAVEAATDGRGDATLEVGVSGGFLITARMDDLMDQARAAVRPDAPTTAVDLVLKPTQGLSGKTVTASGQPVTNATVTCMAEFPFNYARVMTVSVDAQGAFQFPPLPRRMYYLRADAEGFAPRLTDVIPAGSDPLTLVMETGGELAARVVDGATGKPVEGVKLSLRPQPKAGYKFEGESDRLGMVAVKAIVPGGYDLRTWSDGHAGIPVKQTVEIEAGRTTRMEIQVTATGAVAGTVVDSATGQGIAGVTVYAGQANDSVIEKMSQTDATGAYEIAGLPPGDCQFGLRERPPRYGSNFAVRTQMRTVVLQPGERVENQNFELTLGLPVYGRVVYEDGSPAPGAQVQAWSPERGNPNETRWPDKATTNAQGKFQFPYVPEGFPVYLQAERRALRSPEIGPLPLVGGGYAEQTLVLRDAKTSSISGQVVDREGKGVPASIRAFQTDEPDRRLAQHLAFSDGDGYFTFAEVPAGIYEFRYGPYNSSGMLTHTNSEGPVDAPDGKPVKGLRLVLHTDGPAITGTVYNADGEPVEGHSVVAIVQQGETWGPYGTARTDADGRFIFHNVEEGLYRFLDGARPDKARPGDDVRIDLPARRSAEEEGEG